MIIAVDTGGTKTLLALFSHRGTIIKSHRFPTPPDQDDYLREIAQQLAVFISDVDHKKIKALTLASPGTIKKNVIVWGGGNLGWQNVHVASALKPILPLGTPIFVENDANLGGLGETRALSLRPRTSLYLTISTGIGAGIVTDGKIDQILANSEVGQIVLEYEGKLRRWETFASGKAIKKAYGAYARDITSVRAWRHITDRIGRGLLTLIPTLQPDIIIIGGSIGTHFDKYGARLEKLLHKHILSCIPIPPIVQARNPEESVVYGCYYHALNQLARR